MHPAERYYQGKMAGTPDRRLRDKIVRENLPLVITIARDWIAKAPHVPMDDLIQQGAMGLTKAVETFEPERKGKPCRFSVWASIKIKSEIMHYVRDNRSIVRVSRGWTDAYPRILRTEEEWAKRGVRPSESDYLQSLGRTFAEVQQIKAAMENSIALSADQDTFEEFQGAPIETDTLETEYRRAYLRRELDRVKGTLHQILTAEQQKMLQIRERTAIAFSRAETPWGLDHAEQMSLFEVQPVSAKAKRWQKKRRDQGTVEQLSLILFDANSLD